MGKDRTKRQNFELIKGLIESENELDILEILKKENLIFGVSSQYSKILY